MCQAHRNPHGVAIEEVAFSSKANFPPQNFISSSFAPPISSPPSVYTRSYSHVFSSHFLSVISPACTLRRIFPWIPITAILPRSLRISIESSPFPSVLSTLFLHFRHSIDCIGLSSFCAFVSHPRAEAQALWEISELTIF